MRCSGEGLGADLKVRMDMKINMKENMKLKMIIYEDLECVVH